MQWYFKRFGAEAPALSWNVQVFLLFSLLHLIEAYFC